MTRRNNWDAELLAQYGETIWNYLPNNYPNIREDNAQELALDVSIIVSERIRQPDRREEIEQEIYDLWEYDEDYI